MTQKTLDAIVAARRASVDAYIRETGATQDHILCGFALAVFCLRPENQPFSVEENLDRLLALITQEGDQ